MLRWRSRREENSTVAQANPAPSSYYGIFDHLSPQMISRGIERLRRLPIFSPDDYATRHRNVLNGWDAYNHAFRFGMFEDDFWCKFVEHDLAAIFVPEILCRYRVHGASMLRAEGADHNELIVEMSLRHPWLELKAVE